MQYDAKIFILCQRIRKNAKTKTVSAVPMYNRDGFDVRKSKLIILRESVGIPSHIIDKSYNT